MAGCASVNVTHKPASTFTPVKQDSSSTITVWADATRVPAIQAYEKAHPKAKINLVTFSASGTVLQTKINLFDKTGSGWPDVVFDSHLTDLDWAASGKTPFAAPLNSDIKSLGGQVFPAAKLDGFAPGALDPCTVGTTVYCVRNDLAQNVFWFNKKLMDQFGYQVPTTWEGFEALGAKLAKDHPGYVLGSAGDGLQAQIYFWGAKCPINTLKGTSFSSDASSPECVKMAKLIDTMLANGSLTTDALLGNTYPAKYGSKTLGLVGPAWFGQYIFSKELQVPAGQIAAAAPFSWKGESVGTGSVGGGVWFVSSHSTNLKASSALVNWVTTNTGVQAIASTYPAYTPAAKAWLANPQNTSYFANNVGPVFEKAAGEVWDGWSTTSRADPSNNWASYVIPQVIQGKTVEETLPGWQDQITNLAKSVGYDVKTSK
jgi:multiple sugar transport system substrate-binding protein